MRSRTGCLTCRQRKLKCDEVKPICGQCQKASRGCQPNTGLTFRHQHNASMNAIPRSSNDTNSSAETPSHLNGFYAYKNTFGRDVQWVDIPKDLVFRHTTDPYGDEAGRMSDTERTRELIAGIFGNETPSAPKRRKDRRQDGGEARTEDLNTNGLEALSAAALSASPQARGLPFAYAGQSQDNRFQGKTTHVSTTGGPHSQMDFGIDASPRPPLDPSIDPSLTLGHEPDATLSGTEIAQGDAPPPQQSLEGLEQSQGDSDVEEKIESLLRGLNQSPSYWTERAGSKGDGG